MVGKRSTRQAVSIAVSTARSQVGLRPRQLAAASPQACTLRPTLGHCWQAELRPGARSAQSGHPDSAPRLGPRAADRSGSCRRLSVRTCRWPRSTARLRPFSSRSYYRCCCWPALPRADRSRVGRRVLPADIPPGVIRTKGRSAVPRPRRREDEPWPNMVRGIGSHQPDPSRRRIFSPVSWTAGTESVYPCAGTRLSTRRVSCRRCRWARCRASPPRPSG